MGCLIYLLYPIDIGNEGWQGIQSRSFFDLEEKLVGALSSITTVFLGIIAWSGEVGFSCHGWASQLILIRRGV